MSVAPFDHPFLGQLLGDTEAASAFTAEADVAAMLKFEASLADAQAQCGLIPREAAAHIAEVSKNFKPDMASLASGTLRDGVVAPDFVKQLRAAVGEPHAVHVHRGATSQDVIDTSLILRLKPLFALFDRRLAAVIAALENLQSVHGARQVMGHTRMQRALPVTFADKLVAWRAPLERARKRLADIAPDILIVQFGGAVGNRGDLDGKGDEVARLLAQQLGLGDAPVWQTQRDSLALFVAQLATLAGSLGKIGQDVALMTQNEVAELRLAGGGTSSAMAHKSNPVLAEILVTLARFTAGLSGTFGQALVHEYERSGAAWTLEWMTLPQVVVATAASLRHAETLLKQVSVP